MRLGKELNSLVVFRGADFVKRTSDSIIHFVQISRRTGTMINMVFHVPQQIFN